MVDVVELVRSFAAVGAFIVAAAALWRGAFTLRQEYAWRRRQLAINILAAWNDNTAEHRHEISRHLPGVLDRDARRTSLDDVEATQLYVATKEDKERFETRRHIIELLNYCEYVTVAYQKGVADPAILDNSVIATVVDYYTALEPFVRVRTVKRGRDPWAALSDFVVVRRHSPTVPASKNQRADEPMSR